jgi:hypothetical protein
MLWTDTLAIGLILLTDRQSLVHLNIVVGVTVSSSDTSVEYVAYNHILDLYRMNVKMIICLRFLCATVIFAVEGTTYGCIRTRYSEVI